MSEFIIFTSFFLTFKLFTYPTRRRGFNSLTLIKGSPGVRDAQGIKLKYFNDWEGR